MSVSTKRCKIHYRKLIRSDRNIPTDTFAKLVARSLEFQKDGNPLSERVDLRTRPLHPGERTQTTMNDVQILDGMVFGNTCAFTLGDMQALLKVANSQARHGGLYETLEAYQIQEQRAQAGHEYIGGITYWLIIDDHFYQIQHVSLQAKQMEGYFTWLLRDQTGQIPSGSEIQLQMAFDKGQTGGDLGEISHIEIGGLVADAPMTDVEPGLTERIVDTVETLDSRAAGFEKAKDVLDALLGPVGVQRILDQVPDEAALEVKVNIGYRAKKRKFSKAFMGDLAAGLRNLPDGEVRVRGKDGEMRGDDARLSYDMPVKKMSETSSLLDLEHALKQMLEVHTRFVQDGRI